MTTDLFSKLYNNDINKSNLNLLLKEYSADKFVAFLGSGMNSAIKDVCTWEDLYKELCACYKINSTDGDLPKRFSELFTKIPAEQKKIFDGKVFNKIRSKDTSGTLSYMPIARAFDCYVTISYKDPIEAAYEEKNKILNDREIQTLPLKKFYFRFPASFGEQIKGTLTYLHGSEDICHRRFETPPFSRFIIPSFLFLSI